MCREAVLGLALTLPCSAGLGGVEEEGLAAVAGWGGSLMSLHLSHHLKASCARSMGSVQWNSTYKSHFIQSNCSLNKMTPTKCRWTAVSFPSAIVILSLADLCSLAAGFNCCLHTQQCYIQALKGYFHFTSKSEPLQRNHSYVCFDTNYILICP